jgi:hypothetical protein
LVKQMEGAGWARGARPLEPLQAKATPR